MNTISLSNSTQTMPRTTSTPLIEPILAIHDPSDDRRVLVHEQLVNERLTHERHPVDRKEDASHALYFQGGNRGPQGA